MRTVPKRAKLDERKIKQFVDDQGWTHVVKGQRRPPHAGVGGPSLGLPLSDIESGLSPARVAEQQRWYTERWEGSQCCRDLTSIVRGSPLLANGLQIDTCVCLGLGSFTDGRQSSKHQLATLLSLTRALCHLRPITKYVVQDPAFNNADRDFLKTLGYTVVETPDAFSAINPGTFLFAPHLEFEHLAAALRDATPALCIASDVESYLLRLESACISNDKEAVLERYLSNVKSVSFPRYEFDDWWHFTKLYWRSTTTGLSDPEPVLEEHCVDAP